MVFLLYKNYCYLRKNLICIIIIVLILIVDRVVCVCVYWNLFKWKVFVINIIIVCGNVFIGVFIVILIYWLLLMYSMFWIFLFCWEENIIEWDENCYLEDR